MFPETPGTFFILRAYNSHPFRSEGRRQATDSAPRTLSAADRSRAKRRLRSHEEARAPILHTRPPGECGSGLRDVPTAIAARINRGEMKIPDVFSERRCLSLRAAGARCRDAVRPWLDTVYPPCCLRCGDRIRAEDVLCPRCVSDMVPYPVTTEASEDHLSALRYRAAASMMTVGYEFETDGSVSACIHTMKYRGMHRVAHWLGRMIGERLAGSAILEVEPALVPVPLHPIKLIERGFNQAEVICRGIAEETGLHVYAGAMRRVRYTQSQAAMKLHVDERKSNVMNAFEPNPTCFSVVRDRPVLIVDDLITTGATIGECGMALREHGAREVRYVACAKPPA